MTDANVDAESERVREAIVKETVAMYEAGISISSIADELGKSVTTVYALLREGGVEPQRRREGPTRKITDILPKEVVDQVVQDYVRGVSVNKMVGTLDLSVNTIYRILDETGTPTRRTTAATKGAMDKRMEQAIQMYKDGEKLIKIEMETGIYTTMLYKALYLQNIPLRRDTL